MKRILLASVVLFSVLSCLAQSAGPNSPSINTIVPNPACLACPGADWTNPANTYAQDNTYAVCAMAQHNTCFQNSCYYSKLLELSGFGFSVPVNATITGIQVDISRLASLPGSAADSVIQMIQGTTPSGTNEAQPNTWPTTQASVSYGNATDLWGLSWTPSQINTGTTGIAIRTKNMNANPASAEIDHVQMTVFYTLNTGIKQAQTSTSVDFRSWTANGTLHLNFNHLANTGSTVIKLVDLTGKELYHKNLGDLPEGRYAEEIPLEGYEPGIYFMQLTTGNSVITKKVLVMQQN